MVVTTIKQTKKTEIGPSNTPSSRVRQQCKHRRLVYREGWPSTMLQCATCGRWVAV